MVTTTELSDRTKDELYELAKERDYREQLEKALEAKIGGEEIQLVSDAKPESAKVTDLLEALQASVEATKKRSA